MHYTLYYEFHFNILQNATCAIIWLSYSIFKMVMFRKYF